MHIEAGGAEGAGYQSPHRTVQAWARIWVKLASKSVAGWWPGKDQHILRLIQR